MEIARLCDSGLTGDRLLAEVATRLREVVPFDGCFISSTDPDTLLCTQHALADGMPPWVCSPFFHNEFLGDDFNKFSDLARMPSGVRTLGQATGGQLGRSARYVDINSALGFGHEARIAFSVGDRTWAIGNLLRARGSRDFNDSERRFLAAVSEDIARGMRTAILGERESGLLDPDGLPSGPGVVVFDAEGRPISATDEAVAWLRDLDTRTPTTGAETAFGFPLPLAASMLVARARAHAVGRGAPPASVRLRTRTGAGLRLQAACTRTPTGDPGGTALTIAPAAAAELAPTAVGAYDLSQGEQEVTAFLARGFAPADIAARLDLSPDAVTANMNSVLHKTGSSSRGQLASRLFNDHYYPAHNAGCRPLVPA